MYIKDQEHRCSCKMCSNEKKSRQTCQGNGYYCVIFKWVQIFSRLYQGLHHQVHWKMHQYQSRHKSRHERGKCRSGLRRHAMDETRHVFSSLDMTNRKRMWLSSRTRPIFSYRVCVWSRLTSKRMTRVIHQKKKSSCTGYDITLTR